MRADRAPCGRRGANKAMRALLEDQCLRDFFSREAEFLETRRSSLKYPFLNVPPPNHSIAPFAPHAAANRDLAGAHGPPDLGARRTSSFHRSASGVSAASPSGRLLHPTPHAPALGAPREGPRRRRPGQGLA
jgi:hypothetical protein